MGIHMYELASVKAIAGQIILNIFILFLVLMLGLTVVEVVLKCLMIEGLC
jgi:hypothetical protein